MTRDEMGGKLRVLGMSQVDFATVLGVAVTTVHHWKEIPKYVEIIIYLMEQVKKLGGNHVAVAQK
jgi:uncharacterized protein YjcR